jgi:succinate-semialdehyde dehydrogenase/glutarate-semialdehyde dehydrogenase
VLELGGSDPFVVLDGERMERTVEAAAKGRLGNTGQSCVASKRFIVLAEVWDTFLAALRDRFAALRPGDPADPATTFGPLSSERAAQTLIEQVEDAVAKGATVVVGGGRPDLPGAFVEPTILTDVTPQMRAYHEELFGPVAVVHRVDDDDAAVALANDSPYGLGGSVFAGDVERARRVAHRIDSGMVFVNHPALSRPELPFGGVRRSGYGRELAELGMLEFANRKLICVVAQDAPIGTFAG